MPGEGILTKAFECGKCSGRNTDKVKSLNIDVTDIEDYSTAVVSDSSVAWILNTIYSLDVGDHTLYTSEIKKVLGNLEKKHAYAFDGYKRIGIL